MEDKRATYSLEGAAGLAAEVAMVDDADEDEDGSEASAPTNLSKQSVFKWKNVSLFTGGLKQQTIIIDFVE